MRATKYFCFKTFNQLRLQPLNSVLWFSKSPLYFVNYFTAKDNLCKVRETFKHSQWFHIKGTTKLHSIQVQTILCNSSYPSIVDAIRSHMKKKIFSTLFFPRSYIHIWIITVISWTRKTFFLSVCFSLSQPFSFPYLTYLWWLFSCFSNSTYIGCWCCRCFWIWTIWNVNQKSQQQCTVGNEILVINKMSKCNFTKN